MLLLFTSNKLNVENISMDHFMAQLKKHPVSPMVVESSTQFGGNFQMLVIFRMGKIPSENLSFNSKIFWY